MIKYIVYFYFVIFNEYINIFIKCYLNKIKLLIFKILKNENILLKDNILIELINNGEIW